jgi:5-carboxymethyl-2-hydroxymuconate isomerase
MPHILLEYSDNIDFQPSKDLFEKIHKILAQELPTNLSSCKSRWHAHQAFYLGDGSKMNGFVHVTIKVLSGRSDEKKSSIGQEILALLNAYFQKDKKTLHLQLSVEILDLDRNYFKV